MKQLTISKQITKRETQSLDKYFQEIGKIELITAEEEVVLAQKIKAGDQQALEKLARANLRFVVSVAKQYQNKGLALGDLINEGNLGLLKAASRFDEKRGFKFISYAVWWIRQAIIQSLAEQSRIVRLPLNRVNSINKINRTFSELEQEYQREPSTEELAEMTDLASQEVDTNLRISQRQVSVDAPFSDRNSGTMLEVLEDSFLKSPDSDLITESLKAEIQMALCSLNERETKVICCYFGLNGQQALTLEEIGSRLKLTRERVRQIKEKATKRLRNSSRSQALRAYLGR